MTQTDEQQECRALLREKYLNVLEHMADKQIDIATYQGAHVNGLLRSIDYETTNLHVHNLNTPIGCVPEALIRTSDVLNIKFEI